MSKGDISAKEIAKHIIHEIKRNFNYKKSKREEGPYKANFIIAELGFDIEEEVENTLGFHFVVGVDYFLTRNIALNADISYCSVKPKGSWSLTDQVSGTSVSEDFEDLNFNSLLFGIGLKYFF